jgi:hypothetical protein
MAQSQAQDMSDFHPYDQYQNEYLDQHQQRSDYIMPFAYNNQPWMLSSLPMPGFAPSWPQLNLHQPAQQLIHSIPSYQPIFNRHPVLAQQQQQSRPYSTTSNMESKAPRKSTKSKTPDRIPVTEPSAESGGVPDPTSAYLLRASFLPRGLSSPRHMLVIIDLNGTLLFRPSRKAPGQSISRPHAKEFLAYCAETFHVMIWSSARLDNVRKLVNSLLPQPLQKRIVAVWGRESFGLSSADFLLRVMCYKRLSRVWADEEIAKRHPHYDQGERWDQGNTVLIDDTLEKARSEPHNAVQLPEFGGDEHELPAVLPQVHDYINVLACQADISTYIRANPFRAAISTNNETGPVAASGAG